MSQYLNLSQPSPLELSVQKKLRERVKNEVRKKKWSNRDLAKKLNLLPSGAQALMEQKKWTIETALRVAECLRINMDLKLTPNR